MILKLVKSFLFSPDVIYTKVTSYKNVLEAYYQRRIKAIRAHLKKLEYYVKLLP